MAEPTQELPPSLEGKMETDEFFYTVNIKNCPDGGTDEGAPAIP